MKLLLAFLLLALPTIAAPQDYRASILYVAPADSTAPLAYAPHDTLAIQRQPSIAFPILGGAAGGFVGMVGGTVIGASIDQPSDDITPGMAYGFVAGEMLLLPVGVHVGNGRKGNFLADLAVSAVIGTTAVLVTAVSDDGIPLLIGAAAQYGAVVAVERSTAKAKIARATILAREAAIAASPDSAGADSLPPLHAPELATSAQPSLVWPISLGVFGAVAGGLAGAAIGDASDEDSSEDIPAAAALGYFVGETLFMPLGVHLGNAHHGSFAGDLGLSVLGHVASVALSSITGGGGYAIGMAATIALTVANERRVGGRRLQEQATAP